METQYLQKLSEVTPVYLRKMIEVGLFAFPLVVFLTENDDIVKKIQGGIPAPEELAGIEGAVRCLVIEQL